MFAALLILAAPLLSVAQLQALDDRTATVAFRLATRNLALCPDAPRLPGFSLHDLSQYDPGYRPEAVKAYGLDDRPSVLTVAAGSGAERAGLKRGDHLVAINGVGVGRAALATRKPSFDRVAAVTARITAVLVKGAVALTIERNGKAQILSITGDRGCASEVQLIPGGRLDASADGQSVQLTTALASMAQSDDELATIIAHEMAHNILHHRARLKIEGRSAAHIRATEMEADKLSVHMLKAAGYDPMVPARFWAVFGKKTGAGLFSDGTHQRTKDRVRLLAAEANAITQ
jgi:beta-barrel assembly-enhancing protease